MLDTKGTHPSLFTISHSPPSVNLLLSFFYFSTSPSLTICSFSFHLPFLSISSHLSFSPLLRSPSPPLNFHQSISPYQDLWLGGVPSPMSASPAWLQASAVTSGQTVVPVMSGSSSGPGATPLFLSQAWLQGSGLAAAVVSGNCSGPRTVFECHNIGWAQTTSQRPPSKAITMIAKLNCQVPRLISLATTGNKILK